jgi:hypothetical protein
MLWQRNGNATVYWIPYHILDVDIAEKRLEFSKSTIQPNKQ